MNEQPCGILLLDGYGGVGGLYLVMRAIASTSTVEMHWLFSDAPSRVPFAFAGSLRCKAGTLGNKAFCW